MFTTKGCDEQGDNFFVPFSFFTISNMKRLVFNIVGYMDDMEHQVFIPPGQSSHLPLTNWPALKW